MASYYGQSTAKPRNKVVKPILRKFTQSEKNSIDLDRPAADQDGLGIYTDWSAGPRSARDVTFDHSSRRGYHNRSTSGTSQFSTATTASYRAGSFVHPFQQTPRPYTPPPLGGGTYPVSLRGESECSKDSPALTEDELDSHDQLRRTTYRSTSNLSNPSASGATSPITSSHNLRIQTKPHGLRLTGSHSHTNLSSTMCSPDLASPTDTMSPISAVRSSMDKGFRMRTRSDAAESRGRSDSMTIQEARQRFDERQRAKDEKFAQQEVKAREKREEKEARRIEKGHRRSSASERPAKARRSKSDLTIPVDEKGNGFMSQGYNSVTTPDSHWVTGDVTWAQSQPGERTVSTRKKSQSTWVRFMLWFRTRLLRMKMRDRS